MVEVVHREMFERFAEGRLSKDEWTHEAHLIACWVALQDLRPSDALSFLRDAIKTHLCGVEVGDGDISPYHETLTVYYVTAVAAADAGSPEKLFDEPTCGRNAALEFWSRERLFSPSARARWIDPDLGPLPWRPVGAVQVKSD